MDSPPIFRIRSVKLLKEENFPVDFEEKLSYPADLKELLAVQLRLKAGVDIDAWPLLEETHKTLRKLELEGFIRQTSSVWQLTDKGMLFYDTVAVELI